VATLTKEQKSAIQREVSRILSGTIVSKAKPIGEGYIVVAAPGGSKKYLVKTAEFGSVETVPPRQSLEPLVRVVARAVEVFGNSEKALRWINAPVRSLGNQTPVSLLDTPGGMTQVEDALGRIEHGVW
jgi:hypothetical protein